MGVSITGKITFCLYITPGRQQSKTLSTIDERGSKSIETVFFDCHLSPGDINRDLLNNQIYSVWNDYVEPFGLTQVVTEPTRVTSNSKTLIDHIYCNCPENVKSVSVPKLGLSDHFPIFVTRKMHSHIPK